jgi:hypothetical protein
MIFSHGSLTSVAFGASLPIATPDSGALCIFAWTGEFCETFDVTRTDCHARVRIRRPVDAIDWTPR